jgi:hypothetical protein
LTELSNAYPNLPSGQFTADIFRGKISSVKATESRDKYLMFLITTELLSNNALALIALAHRRSIPKPEEHAAYDEEQLVMGLKELAFPPTYAPGCVAMVGERLGHFDKEFKMDDVHCKNAYPTYPGILVLERKAAVLTMLSIVFQRLAGHTTSSSLPEVWRTLATQSFSQAGR